MLPYTVEEMDFFTKGGKVYKNKEIRMPKKTTVKQETEMTNFDFNTIVEEYRKNARLALNYITHPELKSVLEKVVDVQIDMGKIAYNTMNETVSKFSTVK